MSYSFEKVIHSLRNELHPVKASGRKINLAQLEEQTALMHTLITDGKVHLLKVLMSGSSQEQEHFALFYQRDIVVALDLIESHKKLFSSKDGQKLIHVRKFRKLFSRLIHSLLLLLAFLTKYFKWNFNEHHKVPERNRLMLQKEARQMIPEIKRTLKTYDISEELADLLCLPYHDFLSENYMLTFHRMKYFKRFQAEVCRLLEKTSITEHTIRVFLLQQDFNTVIFYDFYVGRIQKSVEKMEDMADVFRCYDIELKLLEQLPVRTSFLYDQRLPGIETQVKKWLQGEIAYLEKHQQLALNYQPITEKQNPAGKLHIKFPVSQLALLLRLAIENGIIKNLSMSELTELVAANFKTDAVENISAGSLRNKAYEANSNAVIKLRDEMMLMVKYLRAG